MDPKTARNDDWNSLMSASEKGNLEVVKYFVEKYKVDPGTKMHDGVIALMKAAYWGHLDVVKYFVEVCKIECQIFC